MRAYDALAGEARYEYVIQLRGMSVSVASLLDGFDGSNWWCAKCRTMYRMAVIPKILLLK